MTLISEEAETALRRIGALSGFYTHSARGLQPTRVARLQRLARPVAPAQLRTLHELVLIRAVSIVEAFAMDLGEKSVRARLGRALQTPPTPAGSREMVEYLLSEKWSSLSLGSWDRLVALWKNGLQVPFSDFTEYEELKFLRLTRHAIAHRVGEYTAQYRRAARKRLVALGIDPDKATGLIPLDSSDVRSSLRLAQSFVLWLDAKA